MNRFVSILSSTNLKRKRALAVLLLVGAASLCVHFLLSSPLSGSALLYVSIPYLLALVIAALQPYAPDSKWFHKYVRFLANAAIVFLASSLVLREGFLCVLLFMPILLIGVTTAFLSEWLITHLEGRARQLSIALPICVLASGLEGTHERLSFDRTEQVTAIVRSVYSAEELRYNLTLPMRLETDRNWLLTLFPMPYEIDSSTFHLGAIHSAKTRYHRWFVTNTHEGEFRLQLTDVSDLHVASRVTHDTSYFSNYLTLLGSSVKLSPLPDGGTDIELTIDYQRDLDPAWYFGPIQRYAIEQTAKLVIQEVIIRD